MNLFLFQVSTPMLSQNFFILSFLLHYESALKCLVISNLLPVKDLLFYGKMCLNSIVTSGSLFLPVTARVLWLLCVVGGPTTEVTHVPAPVAFLNHQALL